MSIQAPTKRSRDADAASCVVGEQPAAASSEERAVRQRTDADAAAAHTAATTPPAAAASAPEAEAASYGHEQLALMRLAVVERQQIMQGLDITSLARLASTCSQLRAEALHREAGKFIPQPASPLVQACSIIQPHPAHASPLFRKHAPMSLIVSPNLTAGNFEALMNKAATFPRITDLTSSYHLPWWTEDLALWLLSLPCMQQVRRVELQDQQWINGPRVQAALFGLPQLQECILFADPTTVLVSSAVALSSRLDSFTIKVYDNPVASVRALRALRLAPALTSLYCTVNNLVVGPELADAVLAEFVCCLPPTLTTLGLSLEIPVDLPRPLAKALFSRTPLLQSVQLPGSIETILRGLLDTGVAALPMLRQVRFGNADPSAFSVDQDSDPIPPLLRRFLHRFPAVTVQLQIDQGEWEDPDQWSAMLERYLAWPRVKLYVLEPDAPIGGPPSPHASDDEDGSDVEEWLDPNPLQSEADSAQSAN